ncbi:hypothetical protein AALP_AA6G112200 [Arabis alpina]|uniref:PLATZ transcription factor family protein n=1 Tax=Arabis alpina TaxID=50452 RepID=A0A087GNJ0_ARAAL|nr:hypothetical protein AALP_AA6G112200 [Arabis alpina]
MAIEDYENPNREIKPKKNKRIMGAGGLEEEDNQWPQWLKPLLKEPFFVQCSFHSGSSKRECNMYCLDCANGSLCYLCLQHHKDHRIIQVRRSSYHDVIRASEIQRFLDISNIQTYVINSAKVVFLNERPQPRPGKGGATNACKVCYRGLVDDCFRFCSLGCKVAAGAPSSCEKRVKQTPMEPENSSNSSGVDNNISNLQSLSPSTTQLPTSDSRKRKSRRKGIPYRSPLQ